MDENKSEKSEQNTLETEDKDFWLGLEPERFASILLAECINYATHLRTVYTILKTNPNIKDKEIFEGETVSTFINRQLNMLESHNNMLVSATNWIDAYTENNLSSPASK